MNLTVGDLFAGIGGIALAFKNAGFKILWGNEYDAKACITYRANFSHKLIEGDIKDIDPSTLEKVSILTAGFPCQPFSIAGYRKGFGDDRGNMFFNILNFIEIHHPQVVLLENVRNLTTHDEGRTLQRMIQELQDLGYYVKYDILNTCEYSDVPQNRERIYILAFKDAGVYNCFEFPVKKKAQRAIAELIDDTAMPSFYYNDTKYYKQFNEEMTNPNTIYQWRRIYLRENKSGLCPTLTANMGTGGHNVPLIRDTQGIRKLTPRECLRFQGFEDSFVLPKLANSALYKQVGNSVSVPVIYEIAMNIKKALAQDTKRQIAQ